MKTLTASSAASRTGPHTAPDTSSRVAAVPGLLALWHLLSLDAPTVAITWTIFVARTWHVTLPASVPCAMFVGVWAIYAADRLLDAGRRREPLEERHLFHGDHRLGFQAVLWVAAAALIPLIVVMPERMRNLYLLLGALLVVWLSAIHLLPGPARRRRIPKELAVGIFFSAAVFLPSAAVAAHPGMWVAGILAANACSLNCLFIYAWEHPLSSAAAAHTTTQFGLRRLQAVAAASIVLPVILWMVLRFTEQGADVAPVAMAVSFTAAWLLLLDRSRGRWERTTLRAAADLALLSPLLVLPFLR